MLCNRIFPLKSKAPRTELKSRSFVAGYPVQQGVDGIVEKTHASGEDARRKLESREEQVDDQGQSRGIFRCGQGIDALPGLFDLRERFGCGLPSLLGKSVQSIVLYDPSPRHQAVQVVLEPLGEIHSSVYTFGEEVAEKTEASGEGVKLLHDPLHRQGFLQQGHGNSPALADL
jgi:hypothetical protein